MRLPDDGVGIARLDRLPRLAAEATTFLADGDVEQVERVALRRLVDGQHRAADLAAIAKDMQDDDVWRGKDAVEIGIGRDRFVERAEFLDDGDGERGL